MGFIPQFLPILIAQVIWGLGYTFTSGALDAWISDEVGEENAPAIFLHGTKMSQWGGLAGVPIAILLAQGQLNTPILVSGGAVLGFRVLLDPFYARKWIQTHSAGRPHQLAANGANHAQRNRHVEGASGAGQYFVYWIVFWAVFRRL